LILGIVRVNPGPLANLALVASRVEPQGDFSLPSRGDGPVKMGHGATSTGLDPFNLQNLITLILHLEGVFNHFTFVHLLEVMMLHLKHHSRPLKGLGEAKGRKKKETGNAQEQKQQNFLHPFLQKGILLRVLCRKTGSRKSSALIRYKNITGIWILTRQL
jgi:hypothetical protein